MKSRENPLELMESNRVYKEKRVGSFDVKVRLLFFTDSLMSRICAIILGERALPFLCRWAPLGCGGSHWSGVAEFGRMLYICRHEVV